MVSARYRSSSSVAAMFNGIISNALRFMRYLWLLRTIKRYLLRTIILTKYH
jgi:hypothetical protein